MKKSELIAALANVPDDMPIWVYNDERQEYLPIADSLYRPFRIRYQKRTSNLTTTPVEFYALVLVTGWTGNMEKLEVK